MEKKIDEWSKSQNIYLEQPNRTEPPPPPQAHTEHVNAVFTRSGKSDDPMKTKKDPPLSILVKNKTEKDRHIKTSKRGYNVVKTNEYLFQSDEVIKSSVKDLVPIPRESEVTSDNESECDVPVNDESSPIFTTFSNTLFDCNDDFTSSDDESLSNEDVLIENFKIYSNSLFDDEESIFTKIDPYYFNAESNLLESFLNQDTLIDSSPKFDFLLEEFSEEIDLFLDTNDLMPPSIKSDDYDSKGDIYFLEELLCNDLLPLPKNWLSNFDHHNDPSFSRPPPEPPDVEIFFDFEPDTGVLTAKVVEDISEHHVLMPKVLPTPPTLCPNIDILLPFSPKNEDKVFKPGILSYLLVSYRHKIIFDFFENPMMMYERNIPHLDVSYLHFYPP
nr:hypothetical protein [Tanacetum cinerariifolium]